jgi:uncharacterized protein (DUF1697 family)
VRPTTLAAQLERFEVVNIGAAGTFVVRRPVRRAQLHSEFARRLPFHAEIVICQGRDILEMVSRDVFSSHPARPDIVRFVSVLSRSVRSTPSMPMTFPPGGKWLLKILAREDRFVFGVYRRHMKVIGYLGALDRIFGAPAITRNWNTVTAIARVLEQGRRSTSAGARLVALALLLASAHPAVAQRPGLSGTWELAGRPDEPTFERARAQAGAPTACDPDEARIRVRRL